MPLQRIPSCQGPVMSTSYTRRFAPPYATIVMRKNNRWCLAAIMNQPLGWLFPGFYDNSCLVCSMGIDYGRSTVHFRWDLEMWLNPDFTAVALQKTREAIRVPSRSWVSHQGIHSWLNQSLLYATSFRALCMNMNSGFVEIEQSSLEIQCCSHYLIQTELRSHCGWHGPHVLIICPLAEPILAKPWLNSFQCQPHLAGSFDPFTMKYSTNL